MRYLTIDDFRSRIGRAFEVPVQGGKLPLTLAAAQDLPASGRQGGSFRLEFTGPHQPILPQGTYSFVQGQEALDIFVVPIGADPRGVRYEAVFY